LLAFPVSEIKHQADSHAQVITYQANCAIASQAQQSSHLFRFVVMIDVKHLPTTVWRTAADTAATFLVIQSALILSLGQPKLEQSQACLTLHPWH
jgi:hypothetical protein